MTAIRLTAADVERAKQIWADYQAAHDVSDRKGQAVGIDPQTGQVWFGESATAIWQQMEAQGSARPLVFMRVGSDYYVRKGGRR
jgi:hypothetical protein